MGLYCHYPLQHHVCERRDDVMGSLQQQNECLKEHIMFIQEVSMGIALAILIFLVEIYLEHFFFTACWQNIASLRKQLAVFEERDRLLQSDADSKCEDRLLKDNSYDSEDVLYSSTRCDDQLSTSSEDITAAKETSTAAKETSTAETIPRDSRNHDNKTDDVDSHVETTIAHNHVDVNGSSLSTSSDSDASVAAVREVAQKRPSLTLAIPVVSPQDDNARGDSAAAADHCRVSPSEVLSPKSYSIFKTNLLHVPEMNLPWALMRTAHKCSCGVTFSYSTKKVGTCKQK